MSKKNKNLKEELLGKLVFVDRGPYKGIAGSIVYCYQPKGADKPNAFEILDIETGIDEYHIPIDELDLKI